MPFFLLLFFLVLLKSDISSQQSAYCYNGGVINLFNMNQCDCPPYFTGDHCENWVCFQGGQNILGLDKPCQCPPGYRGIHCEPVSCLPPSTADQSRQRSLIVNLEATISAIPLLSQLKNALNDNTFAAFATQSFSTFLISSFSQSSLSTSPKTNFYLATNFSDFKLRLNAVPSVSSLNAPQPVFNGIMQALTANSAMFKSAIWTLITSSPQTAADDIVEKIIVQALRWQVQLYFIVANSTTTDLNSFTQLSYLAKQTGGHVIFCSFNDVLQIFTKTAYSTYFKDVVSMFDDTSATRYAEDMVLSGRNLSISVTGNTIISLSINAKDMTLVPSVQTDQYALYEVPLVVNGSATLSVKSANGMPGPISYRVWEYSDADIFLGYVTDLNNDVYDILPTFRISSYAVAKFSPMIGLGTMLLIIDQDQYQVFSKPRPTSCTYNVEFITVDAPEPLACMKREQALPVFIKGLYTDKSPFQRMMTTYCLAPQQRNCQNNGTHDAAGRCKCSPCFTGDLCETSICVKSDNLDINVKRQANIRDEATCSSKNPHLFASNYRTLTLVVELTSRMQQNFFGLQGMEQLLAQIPLLSSFYYQTFALIVFDENQYSTVISTTDFAAFQRALQSELIIAQETPIAADQRVKVVEAISLALQNDQNSYGSIFVFTESLLIDDQNDSAVFRLIEFDKAQVHIYFSTSSSLTSAGIKNSILYDIAAFSGGSIVIGRSGVAINYISSFLPAAHDTIGGDVQFSNNCINGGGQNFTVNVDGTTKYVVLIATGFYPNMRLFAPNGAELTPQLIISDGEMNSYGSLIVAQLLTNGTNQNGLYTVNIRLSSYAAANSQCFLFSRINSDTSAFFGVTSSPTDDFTDSSISISPTNYILSHVSTQFGVYNLQAKLFDYENSSLQLGNSISFDNRPSDVCSYEFQSQQFSCPTTTSGRFRIQVSGMLNGNVQFTRSSFSQCNVISECINGQLVNGTCACNQYWRGINCEIPLCINGGTRNKYVCKCAIGYHGINCQFPDCDVSLVEVDLTILTDSSATITYAGFNGVKNMLIEFLEQGFTISDTKMRIALIHVSDFAFYFKQINVQNNFNETRSLLLRDFYVQGRKGPAFFRGLSLVIDSENLLRPDVKRLTVLISGSNAGDGTNVTQSAIEVGALRQAGIGVYGITFGPYVDANDTELRAILGGPQYISDVYSYGTQSQTISWLTDLVCPQ